MGLLNNRHKQTGEVCQEAVDIMTRLNRDPSEAALRAGAEAATDVTGFGLLGHLHKMCRASGVRAVIDRAAVPVIEPARAALKDRFVSGGTHRNLDWVRPHLEFASGVTEDDLCCWPTRRHPAGCWWSASCPAIRLSATLRPAAASKFVNPQS